MTKALVIDDTRQMADALVQILEILGVEAKAAYGASPAMAILSSEKPDVIFLDINMPGVTGFEILSYLGREPRLEKTSVIVITSDDQPETRERALKGGAKAVIIKPVSSEVIETALWKLKVG